MKKKWNKDEIVAELERDELDLERRRRLSEGREWLAQRLFKEDHARFVRGIPDPYGGGRKEDGDKPRFDLIPSEALEALATVLAIGAAKYGDRNWEGGMRWGRPFAAGMRHLWAWWRGEDKDPETGLSHLAHALCNVVFLLAFEHRQTGADDRPKKGERSNDKALLDL